MKKSIVAIGHAMVDFTAKTTEQKILDAGLTSGKTWETEYLPSQKALSGIQTTSTFISGPAALTAAFAGALGADVTFIGKINDDKMGKSFLSDMKSVNVACPAAILDASQNCPTSSNLTMQTPEGTCTKVMNFGASEQLDTTDLDEDIIARADMILLDSTLLRSKNGEEIFNMVTQEAWGDICLNLSDSETVFAHQEFLHDYLHHCRLVIGNADEFRALFQTYDIHEAIDECADIVSQVICTDGADGVFFQSQGVTGGTQFSPALPVEEVIDPQGAGDSFAGAVMWALSERRTLKYAIDVAHAVAAETIKTTGTRPASNLKEVLRDQGFEQVAPL